jgi:hypothetical protein
MLTVNDRNGICGVNKQWCDAAMNVPSASVQFIQHDNDENGDSMDDGKRRLPLNRYNNCGESQLLDRWNKPIVSISPWLLAIRKYHRVASFHDFPLIRKPDILDLLRPSDTISLPAAAPSTTSSSALTSSLSSSSQWNISMLHSFINLRLYDSRYVDPWVYRRNHAQRSNSLAMGELLKVIQQFRAEHKDGQLKEVSAVAMPPTDHLCSYMENDRYYLMEIMKLFQTDPTDGMVNETLKGSSMILPTIFKYNNELPIKCAHHPQVPIFEVKCAICHESHVPCCYPGASRYYKCQNEQGGCERSPVLLYD